MRRVITMAVIGGTAAGLLFFSTERGAAVPDAVIIRHITQQETILTRGRFAVWNALPARIEETTAWLRPVPAVEVRARACSEIGTRANPSERLVTALIDALHDTSPFVRGAALSALRDLGPTARGAREALLAVYKNPPGGMRGEDIIMALGQIDPGYPKFVSLLLEVLNGKTGAESYAALSVLETKPALYDAAVPARLAEIYEREPYKYELLSALVRFDPKSAKSTSLLLEALRGENSFRRRIALQTIQVTRYAAPEVRAELRRSYAQCSSTVPAAGIETGAKQFFRNGTLSVPNPARNEASQLNLLRTFAALGPAAAEFEPEIARTAENTNSILWLEAALTCLKISGNTALAASAFEFGIHSRDAEIRDYSLRQLEHNATMLPETAKLLLPFLENPDRYYRLRAVRILSKSGTNAASAIPILQRLAANDPVRSIRNEAADAVRNAGAGRR